MDSFIHSYYMQCSVLNIGAMALNYTHTAPALMELTFEWAYILVSLCT